MIRTLLSSIAGLLLVSCAFGSGVTQEPSPVPTAQRIATVPTLSPLAQVTATVSSPLPIANIAVTAPTPSPTAQVPVAVPSPVPTIQVTATVPTPSPTTQRIATVPTPSPTAQASDTVVVEHFFQTSSPPPYWGRRSLEEDIAWSSVVIRGTFDSVRAVGVQDELLAPGRYIGGLEYTFTVHEYLKGSGANQLQAVATVWYDTFADTAAAAADLARPHIDRRDTRWDGWQAIVFMRQSEDGYLWMGATHAIMLGGRYPVWLPDAVATSTAPGGASGTSGAAGQYFLLDDPDAVQTSGAGASGAASATTASQSTSTVSLSDIKSRVNVMEARMAAGGGSQEYRECVRLTYRYNRITRFATKYSRTDGAIRSGLPAGTRMVKYPDDIWLNLSRHGTTTPAWVEGNVWYEGRDAPLFDYEYPGFAISKRPLPMGEYKAFRMWRSVDAAM